ncbi:MAG: hypothetical protein AAGC60_21170 [Acidobacteriota bacterium]
MPKVGDWWVATQGLLTSGNDPAPEIGPASDQFPDETDPMVFMTGDGHRHPPFAWTNRGVWQQSRLFHTAAHDDKLVCHVEKYQADVSAQAVPAHLREVYDNGKVFGWEPEFYRVVQEVMEELLVQIPKACLSASEVRSLTSDMYRVHHLGYLRALGTEAMEHWDSARRLSMQVEKTGPVGACTRDAPIPAIAIVSRRPRNYNQFLRDYMRAAFALRTQINNVIGANIQRNIDRYPDHIHLITCGDAHVTTNPLYRYVQPPVGTFGIADSSRG